MKKNIKIQNTNECNIHLMVKSEYLASFPYKLNSVKIESKAKYQLLESEEFVYPNGKICYFVPIIDMLQSQSDNVTIHFGFPKKRKPLTMKKGMYFVFSILPKAKVELIFDIVDKPVK